MISSQRTGLGGKTVVELGLDPAVSGPGGAVQGHGIRVGDIVLVSEQPPGSAKKREVKELESKGARGVVVRVGKGEGQAPVVSVALDREEDDENALGGTGGRRLWVVKLANDVTFKR